MNQIKQETSYKNRSTLKIFLFAIIYKINKNILLKFQINKSKSCLNCTKLKFNDTTNLDSKIIMNKERGDKECGLKSSVICLFYNSLI